MTLVKFCGNRREEDIRFLKEAGGDLAGFILTPGFKRSVEPEFVKTISKALPENIRKVGVFVNEPVENIIRIAADDIIDMIQLHGDEDEDYIRELKKLAPGRKIIKVFIVKGEDDIRRANESSADLVLLDAGVGGSGKLFDQSLIKGIERDFILAGGLNDGNVARAIENAGPHLIGVDVSSGVETDGYKDREKMIRFSRNAKKEY